MDFFSNNQPRGPRERPTCSIQPRRFALAIVVGLLAVLTGCASASVVRQPFNKSTTPIDYPVAELDEEICPRGGG